MRKVILELSSKHSSSQVAENEISWKLDDLEKSPKETISYSVMSTKGKRKTAPGVVLVLFKTLYCYI